MANNTLPTSRVNSGPCSKDEYPTYPVDPGYEVHIPYEEPEEPCPCESTCEVNQCSNSDDEIHIEKKEYTYGFSSPLFQRAREGGKKHEALNKAHVEQVQEMNNILGRGESSTTTYSEGTSTMNFYQSNGDWSFSTTSPHVAKEKLPTFNMENAFADIPEFANKTAIEMIETWNTAFATKVIEQVHWTKVLSEDIDVYCFSMGSNGTITLGANMNKTTTLRANVNSKLTTDLTKVAKAGGGSLGRGGVNPNSSADASWNLYKWQLKNTVTHSTTERWHPCMSLRYEKTWEYTESDGNIKIETGSTLGGGWSTFKKQWYISLSYLYNF